MILAGDIGGTKTVLALFETDEGSLRRVVEATFPSAEYPSLEAIVAVFLARQPELRLEAACFGVAGPVRGGSARTTNLPWLVEEQRLAGVCGGRPVTLINDLQAAAYGMLALAPDEITVLQPATEADTGNVAVIAPGTGLGEAMLFWDGRRYHPIASEGGHADFAPRTPQEIELLQYLQRRLGGHVSYERVLSGDGIHNLYTFLRETGTAPEPAWLTQRLAHGDPNATIAQVGLAGEDAVCATALDLFSSILGAEAGNLALKCLALSGVFVGGGIAPRMLSVLGNGSFLRGFVDKGRFSEAMKTIPVRVALNPQAPLLGAARFLVDHAWRTG